MKVRVRVPATTANMGPGFDCLGMALSLYNEVEFEVPDKPAVRPRDGTAKAIPVVRVMSGGKPYAAMPLPKNLIYQSFANTLRRVGVVVSSVTLNELRTEIPMARGLGSSAACIAAGVLAAAKIVEELAGYRLSFHEAMDLAVEMEGHPDNVVPAMVGGMTVAVRAGDSLDGGQRHDGDQRHGADQRQGASQLEGASQPEGGGDETRIPRTVYAKISVPSDLIFAAIVPDFRLSTEEARRALPLYYRRADSVFNVGRVALLAAAFASGDLGHLRVALDDRLHQPYRLALVPNSSEVLAAAKSAGSMAEFLSGAGPTIMAIIKGDGAGFAAEVSARLSRIPGDWVVRLLKPEMSGAAVEIVTSGTGGNS